MLQQQLTMSLEAKQNERDTKAARKSERQEDSAANSGELSSTAAARSADQTYYADLKALCSQKSSDFDARQALRQEELAAIQKAIDIIGSGSVAGKADRHLP